MRIILALGLAVGASPALAERPDDRYWLSGTAMFASARTKARIDASSKIGTEISLERDIGVADNETLPVVLVGARLSDHWRVEAEYLRLRRSGSAIIARPITIGNTTYNVNSKLSADLSTDTYRVGIGYSFVRNEKAELGASIGAHITRFKQDFVGSGTVNNNATVAIVENRAITAPLPTLGIYGTYVLSPMFSINGRIDYLSIKISDIKGKLIDTQLGVTARVIKNVGIGAGYRYVEYDVVATKNNFRGELDFRFHGPVVFAELAF